MPIIESDTGNAWFLVTPATTYAIGMADDGLPTQLYWGPGLPPSDWSHLERRTPPRWQETVLSRASETADEVLADGGERWGVSGLQITFPGGDHSLELTMTGAKIESHGKSDQLTLTLSDALFPLLVKLHYRVRHGSDVIERWVELSHGIDGTGPISITRADSANWFIGDQNHYRYSSVHGEWAAETQLRRAPLPFGELTLTSRTGNTSHQANPWIMIDDGSATETFGVVRSIALAWSGTWRLTAQHRDGGGVSVTTGFGHDGITILLSPGESLSTPPSFGLVSEAGFGAASRSWHAFARTHLRPNGSEVRPIIYNSWEATEFNVLEDNQKDLASLAAKVGAELFVVDDGWFAGRNHDRAGLGDWTPDRKRFPHGLHGLVDHVRTLGMKFGLWVEPEMVNPDSDLYRNHPDWVLHFPHRRRRERRNQLVLNFGRPDVQEWALDWLDNLVTTYQLDFLKWDMNRYFTQAGWPDKTDSQGSLWLLHTRGVYNIMATLRHRHPSLRIESCAGGGGRVDLGMMEFVDQFWTSDNTDAIDRQSIQHGFTQLYPPITMTNWVTDSPNPFTKRETSLEYRFHVAMAGTLGIGADLSNWDEQTLSEASSHIARYKDIRDVIQFGELYRLGELPGCGLSAIEYVHDDRVVVLSYSHATALQRGTHHLLLEGLKSKETYTDEESGETFSGAFLRSRGLPIQEKGGAGPENAQLQGSDYGFVSSLRVLRRDRAEAY